MAGLRENGRCEGICYGGTDDEGHVWCGDACRDDPDDGSASTRGGPDIKDTDAQKDGRSILYTMRDGSVWRNDLRGVCKDARWNGFGYSTANPQSSICENEQTLVVFRSGETCGLGNFTQVTPPRM